jgi:histidinol-phosphate aminotransferase
MVRVRSDIASIRPYVPGRRIDEIAREVGLDPDSIVKLASNESPWGPFPGVDEAMRAAMSISNRYPDNDFFELRRAVASTTGAPGDHLWFGAGTTGLLGHIAAAVGGEGTSAVYGWPSFVMYRIITKWAGADAKEVRLDGDMRLDLDKMLSAVGASTTVVYLCNPNNPTGTVVPGRSVAGFIDAIPQDVVVVVDEAYHDFVEDPEYQSAIGLAVDRPNVMVTRTFSKVYALASLRIGYAVASPALIADLRKAQPPFSVSQVAQAAATASLGDRAELERRVAANAEGRRYLEAFLADRGLAHSRSQANFVFFELGDDSEASARDFTDAGVIVRPMSGGWLRVTVGTEDENRRFTAALDAMLARPGDLAQTSSAGQHTDSL